jgi:hypothetical protein
MYTLILFLNTNALDPPRLWKLCIVLQTELDWWLVFSYPSCCGKDVHESPKKWKKKVRHIFDVANINLKHRKMSLDVHRASKTQ